jgi:hypothetical protein
MQLLQNQDVDHKNQVQSIAFLSPKDVNLKLMPQAMGET